ncbi:MAG: hypothetical protein AAFR96_05975 [Planctomycetota bacterium]
MKSVLGWLKSNVVIVILAVLAVGPPPVAWYFSNGMNASLREGRQSEAQRLLRDVQNAEVTYELTPISPDQEPVTVSGPPNAQLTEVFRAEQARRLEQVAAVKAAAIEFNRRGRGALVDGLFPAPSGQSQLLRNKMARRMVAADTPESAYRALFESLRIRPAVDAEGLGSLISARRERKVAEITGDQGEQTLTPEQRQQIDSEMLDVRIGRYRTHADGTALYGSLEVLPLSVPRVAPSSPPPLELCFAWQNDYWLIEDVLRGLVGANSRLDESGVGGNVVSGAVKRLISLEIDAPAFGVSAGGSGAGAGDSGGRDFGRQSRQPQASAGAGGAATITGRAPGQSGLYDVRTAQLSLIVSSAKLPALLDALASSNFMTVIDVDLAEADPWSELEAGFYAGSDAVVRADVRVEVLHLRDWTAPLMPDTIKAQLGIATGGDEEG